MPPKRRIIKKEPKEVKKTEPKQLIDISKIENTLEGIEQSLDLSRNEFAEINEKILTMCDTWGQSFNSANEFMESLNSNVERLANSMEEVIDKLPRQRK